MASPQRYSNRSGRDSDNEPFPSFPAGPSSQTDQNTHTTSTTVTTTTVIDGRNDPVTTTSTQFPIQAGNTTVPAVITTGPGEEAPIPFSQTRVTVPAQPTQIVPRRRPIGIRRLPSATSNRISAAEIDDGHSVRSGSGRRRSASDPQARLNVAGGGSTRLTRQGTQDHLPALREEATGGAHQTLDVPGRQTRLDRTQSATGTTRRRSVSNTARSIVSRFSNEGNEVPAHEYEDDIVDYLDVIGKRLSCLVSTTTNNLSSQTLRCRL
jgi:hypothetical protein